MTINIDIKLDPRIELKARRTLDGNILILDHEDIDIVLMLEKGKCVTFPKSEMSDKVYYTQDRMINAEDYNVFPISKVSGIEKLKAINKTHAGHSRFIDIQDPTGTVANVNCIGEDGVLYKEPNNAETILSVIDNSSYDSMVTNIEKMIQTIQLQNFFYLILIFFYHQN